MPQHKSCKKRMRTNTEERNRNRAYRSQVRGFIRDVQASSTQAEARDRLRQTNALLDRLTRKGILHKNSAANYKSKLTKFVDNLPA